MFSCFSSDGGNSSGKGYYNVTMNTITKTGLLHDSTNTPNQDTALMLERPNSKDPALSYYLAGVFDGHGDLGHDASALASRAVSSTVEEALSGDPTADLETVLRKGCDRINEEIGKSSYARTAGCTGTMVLIRGAEFVAANVGDSTAVLVSRKGSNQYYGRFRTIDHRLDVPSERERIEKFGGIVYENYVVDKVEQNKGLMVTRTFGDVDMRQNGVSGEPDYHKLEINKQDKYFLLASDGLWDADGMTIELAVGIVGRHIKKSPTFVCQELLTAVSFNGPSDDCTLVCVQLS